MDHEQEKLHLINTLKREGIRDPKVLQAMVEVPREAFVGEAMRDHAWDNVALSIARGQTISQPYVVAFMTEALEVTDRHKVLEIGTGSGYQAAVLAALCRRVYTIERHKLLYEQAKARFEALDIGKVTARHGDGTLGWPEQAPFDRIMITAAATEVPEALIEQLDIDGILIAPVGTDLFSQKLIRIERDEEGIHQRDLLPVRFVPLVSGMGETE